jgi:uracil-DNA glycosylase family 4
MVMANHLHALNQEIRCCNRCRLAESRKNAVCGEGNPSARLMFVAQAPGENEDREGIMFIGPSGMVLNEMLSRIKIKREEIYMTNLIKCRLPKNRKPKADEIETCARFLDREIAAVKPGILVPLGYYATRYLFEKYGISRPSKTEFHKVYGNIYGAGDQDIIPIQHPAARLHNPGVREEMLGNYSKLQGRLRKGVMGMNAQ